MHTLVTRKPRTPEKLRVRGSSVFIIPCQTTGVSYKSSLTALFCVCNYLLAAVALQDHDHAMDTLAITEELLGQGFFVGI